LTKDAGGDEIVRAIQAVLSGHRPAAVRHPGECLGLPGGVALSYLTPVCGWQTIWRTLANPGE
ncbi:hypothetical protein ABZT10_30870, partial [Streptomyces sp900116325]